MEIWEKRSLFSAVQQKLPPSYLQIPAVRVNKKMRFFKGFFRVWALEAMAISVQTGARGYLRESQRSSNGLFSLKLKICRNLFSVRVRVPPAAPLAGRFFKSLPVFYVYLSLNQRCLQLRLPRLALTHCPGVRRYLLSWNNCCAPTTPGFVSWRFRLQAEAKRSYVGDRETECDEDYFL